MHSRLMRIGENGPIVSFGFDDFPRSAYTAGGEILKNFGARGTYYVSLGLMNTSNDLGEQFRLDDLHSLVKDGHELASHTFVTFRAAKFRYSLSWRMREKAGMSFVKLTATWTQQTLPIRMETSH